jgi:hypothetical protein
MMEAARTSEMSVNFYQATRRYNLEDSHLRTHRRKNLKSYLGRNSLKNIICTEKGFVQFDMILAVVLVCYNSALPNFLLRFVTIKLKCMLADLRFAPSAWRPNLSTRTA